MAAAHNDPARRALQRGSIHDDAATPLEGERFETLLAHRNLQVERIISSSRITPTRYVQPQDEWVLLLHGHAALDVDAQRVELKAGDYLFLPAGMPHTVLQASDGATWLAIHLHPPLDQGAASAREGAA